MREHPHSTTGLLAATAIGVAALILVLVPAVFFALRYNQVGFDPAWRETGPAMIAAAVAAIGALLLFGAFPLQRMRGIEDELRYRAEHDILTGLANRGSLPARLAEAIARAQRQKTSVAVMFLDLDDFKMVNDTLGHAAGDTLLREVSARLRDAIRKGDTVARLGGDEFALVFDNMRMDSAATVATALLQRVRKPYSLAGRRYDLTCCIGIAMYPGDGMLPEQLLGYANTAMQDCKRRSKSDFAFYSRTMQAELESRLGRQVLARQAWERREFRIHYQPITDTRERRLTGAEALLRWTTEELGAVPPQEFVATLEEMGLIAEVGDWVLQEACEQAREWSAAGLPTFVMSVNISPRHFKTGEALVASVRTALASSGLDAGRLQLEITESAMMEDRGEALLTINQLKALGVGIAVDDFGTGYSSLSYLKYFPVDALKIDKVFVSDLAEQAAESNIVLAIVQLAKGLRLSVIAEGVETQRQLDLLQAYGCDVVQGYMIGQPMAPRQFEDRFLRNTRWLEDTTQLPVARPHADWDDRTIPVR